MSFNFKEMIRFSYGLVMGTSTPFLKPSRRFLFPLHRVNFDAQLGFLLGGSGVCGMLFNEREALIINVNQGVAAGELRRWLTEKGVAIENTTVVLNSTAADFSTGLAAWSSARRILVGPSSVSMLKSNPNLGSAFANRVEVISTETELSIAGERVRLLPVGPAATASDLAVFLEDRQILFAGALFYNRIHPVLRREPGVNARQWKKQFVELLKRWQPRLVIPAEGDVATLEEAQQFVQYLDDLQNPAVEFSYCRSHYDWPEIPSLTSLEETFDYMRA